MKKKEKILGNIQKSREDLNKLQNLISDIKEKTENEQVADLTRIMSKLVKSYKKTLFAYQSKVKSG